MAVDNQFQTLTVRRGQDAVVGVSDTPDDLTGYALRFCVRAAPGTDSAALLTRTTGGGGISTPTAHAFDVSLTKANLLALAAGRYAWDCWRTDAGSESQLCGGDFYVLERATLATPGRLRLHLGLTSAAEDGLLEQLLGQVSATLVNLIGWDPTPRAGVTEFYDGTGTEWLPLRTPVVRTVTTVHVDEDGAYGRKAGSFAAPTLLTDGVDYALRPDGPGGAYSRSGLLERLGDVWPWRWTRRRGTLTATRVGCPGAVKVVADVGFPTVPEDLELAALTVCARVRRMRQYGTLLQSEGYENYSYSLAPLVRQAMIGDPEMTVARYKSFVLW